MRGEESNWIRVAGRDLEIPPRARGRVTRFHSYSLRNGNTPACAGKSTCRLLRPVLAWKYPRVRGEEDGPPVHVIRTAEIPPRARGRGRPPRPRDTHRGNTPACAGKSWCTSHLHDKRWKYPRVRGEELNYMGVVSRVAEIPPRARGRESPNGTLAGIHGNTPACAGKSTRPR